MHFSNHHLSLLIGSLTLPSAVQAVPSKYVAKCLSFHNVPFVISNSPDWTSYTTPHNLRLIYEPAVITIPETARDVSASVVCAKAAGLKVQPKGGGHSYASYSSGGRDGSLIVDLEKFDLVEVNQATFVAKIGAGQRLGNVATELFNQGQRAIPHGVCPGVGIAGHALHGGWGFAARYWGYSLDTILGLDVVLANGTQVYASSTSFPDLFWAMRGAGESFGIATYLYVQTQPAPPSTVLFTSNLSASLTDIETVSSGFEHVQRLILTSPLITPNMTFGFNTDGAGVLSISGSCIGCNAITFNNTVLSAILSGFKDNTPIIQTVGWLEGLASVAGQLGLPLQQPLGHEYNVTSTFYVKSLMTKNAHPLTTASIRSFWSYVLAHQGEPFRSVINLYGGPGSAVNIPSSNATAFSRRDAMWVFENFGISTTGQLPFDPNTITLVQGLVAAVENAQPDGDFSAYLNYIDPELDARTAARLYYGAETYNRLLELKWAFDPKFLFWNPQAVGNSLTLNEE
ncbi:hypothetical protein VTL71DRAFT_16481 [Oculimacula yallundae]|uniref:FAD-binding PCMH-type domain-containing protein n=1 Tax=Oculimacula yallundae TaxID=86028 RepID=A0ABR4CEP5_9HELO